jgi:hypothetical protein
METGPIVVEMVKEHAPFPARHIQASGSMDLNTGMVVKCSWIRRTAVRVGSTAAILDTVQRTAKALTNGKTGRPIQVDGKSTRFMELESTRGRTDVSTLDLGLPAKCTE